MDKQAFLIMAHSQFNLLCKLISKLDSEYVDIFLHLDKKWSLTDEQINYLREIPVMSQIYFTKRINVMWGGYSQIEAELALIKMATATSSYNYYHLITGQDYPIVSINNIVYFYNKQYNREFINYSNDEFTEKQLNRTKYYWVLRDRCGRNNGIVKNLQRILVGIQKILRVDRNKKFDTPLKMGSAYFDITDKLANWVIENEYIIRERFNNTSCADECFLQTIVYKTQFYNCVFSEYECNNYRFIDWNGGENSGPRVLDESDYEDIISSGCFFARKIDDKKSKKLIDLLNENIDKSKK